MKTMTKKIVLIFIAITMLCVSCRTKRMKDKGGTKYTTVKIGEQIWMAENLNYETSSGSWCYDDDPANCEKYGRLYDWGTAKKACPHGWRLPSKSDFETLLRNVGGSGSNAYHALKDGGSSGFSALLGGWRSNDGNFFIIGFYTIGSLGLWWSSSEGGTGRAWNLYIYSSHRYAYMGSSYEEWGFSVRCLQDSSR